LILKCKIKGRKEEIQLESVFGFRVDQISLPSCIHHNLDSLKGYSEKKKKLKDKER